MKLFNFLFSQLTLFALLFSPSMALAELNVYIDSIEETSLNESTEQKLRNLNHQLGKLNNVVNQIINTRKTS